MHTHCPDQDGLHGHRRRIPHHPEDQRIGDVASAWLLLAIVAGFAGLFGLLLFNQ
jgi:hypothetical protein